MYSHLCCLNLVFVDAQFPIWEARSSHERRTVLENHGRQLLWLWLTKKKKKRKKHSDLQKADA